MLILAVESSRNAAKDETENASRGASMICSTFCENGSCKRQRGVTRRTTYNGFEESNLHGRVVRCQLCNFVSFSIYLKKQTVEDVSSEGEVTTDQCIHLSA